MINRKDSVGVLMSGFLPLFRSGWMASVLGLCLVAWSGCSSPAERRAERRSPPQPVLDGEARFLEGALVAQLQLTSFRLERPDGGRGGAGPKGERAGGGAGGMRPPGGGGGMRGADGQGGEGRRMMRAAGGFPRQTLRVTFANRSPDPIEIEVVEVKSLLGNFAPRPERLELGPAQEGALEPMNASFQANLDALDVAVTVRQGDRSDRQTVRLTRAAEGGGSEDR